MKGRCYNPKNASYRRYGGRGITVIERWRNSFEAISGRRYGPSSIPAAFARPDRQSTRIFRAGKCGGRPAVVQKRNSGGIFRVNIGGKIVCLKEACDLRGVSYDLVRNRVRRGWPIEKALATPKMADGSRKKPRRIDRRPDRLTDSNRHASAAHSPSPSAALDKARCARRRTFASRK